MNIYNLIKLIVDCLYKILYNIFLFINKEVCIMSVLNNNKLGGVCVYVNEGEKIIKLIDVESDIDMEGLYNRVIWYMNEGYMEKFNDMVSECVLVGDDDVSWYGDEIEEMFVSEYSNKLLNWMDGIK